MSRPCPGRHTVFRPCSGGYIGRLYPCYSGRYRVLRKYSLQQYWALLDGLDEVHDGPVGLRLHRPFQQADVPGLTRIHVFHHVMYRCSPRDPPHSVRGACVMPTTQGGVYHALRRSGDLLKHVGDVHLPLVPSLWVSAF